MQLHSHFNGFVNLYKKPLLVLESLDWNFFGSYAILIPSAWTLNAGFQECRYSIKEWEGDTANVIFSGTLCNSGDHDHSAHDHGGHHHHHHHGGAAPDLEDLIKNFGIAVLGKDQESANDVSPTADHSHVNIKALIE